MLNLNIIEKQINDFYDETGDDISDVVNYENSIGFSHISLIEKNFSYNLLLSENGTLTLTKNVSVSNDKFLDNNADDGSTKTLLKTVNVKSKKVNDIEDIVDFIKNV